MFMLMSRQPMPMVMMTASEMLNALSLAIRCWSRPTSSFCVMALRSDDEEATITTGKSKVELKESLCAELFTTKEVVLEILNDG